MHKERKTAKETFVLIKTGFPFPEREFAVEKHFFKTGLTFLSVLTNISFLNIAFGTVYVAHRRDNFVIDYLEEIETEFENTLVCLSVAQIGSNHEKNWRLKIS